MTELDDLATFGKKYPKDPAKRKIFRTADDCIDWVQIFLAIIIVLLITGASTVFYLRLYEDNPPVEFLDFRIIKESAEPGGLVIFNHSFCKFTTAAPKRDRSWINGITITTTGEDPPSNDPGCYNFDNAVRVPLELLPGPDYYIVQTFTYEVNPLAQRSVMQQIGPFTILEATQ